jgi:hypothetical protein
MSGLPVTDLVLFKHGIGFFQRRGQPEADEVTLTFRHDEINDVLKSLVVLELGEGEVLGIHYQTPFDQERLSDSSIRLSDKASLCDLIRDLRGRMVELLVMDAAARGRVIGLDLARQDEPLENSLVSIVRPEDGQVQVFQLKAIRGLSLLDARAEHDLSFFLDSSMSEELRRSLTIRMSATGAHHLAVSYVAPSPTWRVSYRIVAQSDEGLQTGRAVLQGWGLFDNRLDEDLENVSVTLVAGQPISFIYDLYSSRIPERPVVEDEARVAPGPIEYRAERAKRARAADFIGGGHAEARQVMAMAMPVAAEAEFMDMAMDSLPAAAEGQEAGEFFQYVVTKPVSVRRGESALVPILSAELGYARELLYNGAKLSAHPVIALRLDNATGLTLERGPVTILIDADYKGEAVIPFTRAGSEVYLAYAVELGIRITEHKDHHVEMAGLNIRDGYLIINEYDVQVTRYLIDSATPADETVTIEATIEQGYEPFEMPPPDAETASERRWRVSVPARGSAEFSRRERRLRMRHEQVQNLNYRQLRQYFKDRWLDERAFKRLEDLLSNLALINQAHADGETLKAERASIYERQGQLRENLNALKADGEEGMLRARMLRQLEETENRLDEISGKMADADRAVADAQARITQILAELQEEPGR